MCFTFLTSVVFPLVLSTLFLTIPKSWKWEINHISIPFIYHWFSNSPPYPKKFIEIIVYTDPFYLIHFQLNPIWPLFPLELFVMKVINSYCQGQWRFLSSPSQPCSGHHCNWALPFLKHSPLPCFAYLTSHPFTIHFADSFYSNQILIMDFSQHLVLDTFL